VAASCNLISLEMRFAKHDFPHPKIKKRSLNMNIKDAISLANNVVNPADADKLKTAIYDLQQENIDLKMKLQECISELQVYQEWDNTKSLYEEYKAFHGAVVYVKIGETKPVIFYCPACFSKKAVIPLQKLDAGIASKLKVGHPSNKGEHFCPSCEQVYYCDFSN